MWTTIRALLALCLASLTLPASATSYFTMPQAQKALFPDATEFQHLTLTLRADQVKAIRKIADTDTPLPDKTTWKAMKHGQFLGYFIADHVIGKHEYIQYAVGLNPHGAVLGMEIMDYRETYGGQVRHPSWRAQFTGKQHGTPLMVSKDIDGISGATLSVVHLTKGVKRVLAFHEFGLKTTDHGKP